MENIKNNNEVLVNFLSNSTAADYQNYTEPTVNTESLSFKMKNNYLITFEFPEIEPRDQTPKTEKEELVDQSQ